MLTDDIPEPVQQVFRCFLVCELSTISKNGAPVTVPIESYFQADRGMFLLTTPIGLTQKVVNIRRNSKVSLFFSSSVGSDLYRPPAVLVQGDAVASDEIMTDYRPYWTEMTTLWRRQSLGNIFYSNTLMRFLFDWFFMRLFIFVTPKRILWWECGDFSLEPSQLEVSHVG